MKRGVIMFDFIDGQINGLETMIMNSSVNADRVIDAFEEAIRRGEDPEIIEGSLYRSLGIDPTEFLSYDKERINDAVNEIWERYN